MTNLPFESYPDGGRQLTKKITGSNCRHGYGRVFQQLTKQESCAYCGMSLIDSFEHWLQMALDHVVPSSVCRFLKIKEEWSEDAINKVLACAGCNTFGNRYKPDFEIAPIGDDLEAFCKLRDDIFKDRKEKIHVRRESELKYYLGEPWTSD